MRQFLDCDLWLVISDRLPLPLLPIRPYILLVHDYLQRYLPHGSGLAENLFLQAARLAERVLATTRFTEGDARQYAGIDPKKVARVPMLVPQFEPEPRLSAFDGAPVLCLADKRRRAQEPPQFVQGTEDLLGKDRREISIAT